MVNPSRTPTLVYDQRFTNQTDRTIQYQEACLAFKTALTTLGGGSTAGTIRSSNTVTAGAGDNWTVNGDIVSSGTPGSGSWFTAQLGSSALYGGSALYFLLYCNDAASPPQGTELRFSGQPYTGGSTSALPTTAGAETAILTAGNNDLTPWTSVTTGAIHYSTTAEGDMWFGTKEVGVAGFRFLAWLNAFTSASGGAQGSHCMAYFSESAATTSVTSANLFTTASAWRGLLSGGATMPTNTLSARSSLWDASPIWTSGVTFSGAHPPDAINLWDAGTGGRFMGQCVDFYATAPNLPWASVIDNETGQVYRRVNLGPGTNGSIYVYMRTSDVGTDPNVGVIP